jgi:hypothetical protein
MSEKPILKDERTRAVENASGQFGFVILLFGLMLDIIARSWFYGESNWDLFALVVISSLAATVYQATHRILPPHFMRSLLVLGAACAVLAAVVTFLVARFR